MTKKVDFGMQGDSLEVEDGGVVEVKSGGRVHMETGAVIELATGADIKVNGDSLIAEIAALTGLDSGELAQKGDHVGSCAHVPEVAYDPRHGQVDALFVQVLFFKPVDF